VFNSGLSVFITLLLMLLQNTHEILGTLYTQYEQIYAGIEQQRLFWKRRISILRISSRWSNLKLKPNTLQGVHRYEIVYLHMAQALVDCNRVLSLPRLRNLHHNRNQNYLQQHHPLLQYKLHDSGQNTQVN
jgi:hypothetical protein